MTDQLTHFIPSGVAMASAIASLSIVFSGVLLGHFLEKKSPRLTWLKWVWYGYSLGVVNVLVIMEIVLP